MVRPTYCILSTCRVQCNPLHFFKSYSVKKTVWLHLLYLHVGQYNVGVHGSEESKEEIDLINDHYHFKSCKSLRATHIIFSYTRGMPYAFMLYSADIETLTSRRDGFSGGRGVLDIARPSLSPPSSKRTVVFVLLLNFLQFMLVQNVIALSLIMTWIAISQLHNY